ncbi:MAG: hypothetical protein AAF244_04230, partial [Pseudomonadota bacterium]
MLTVTAWVLTYAKAIRKIAALPVKPPPIISDKSPIGGHIGSNMMRGVTHKQLTNVGKRMKLIEGSFSPILRDKIL